jgi:hypothetical protein
MRWAELVAHIGEMRNVYKILMENLKEEKVCGKLWSELIWLRIGTIDGLL